MIYFLITRPNHDGPNSYLYYWSKDGIKNAENCGLQVINLEGKNATKAKVESYLNGKLSIPIVVFNGHGTEETIKGYNDEIIIKVGTNEALLKDKITYSIACGAAKRLGAEAVKNGGTYMGYLKDFKFYHDPDMESRPLQDGIAKLYLEHYQILIAALVKGNRTKDAHQKAKRALAESLKAALASTDSNIASALYSDYQNFVLLGDKEAKV